MTAPVAALTVVLALAALAAPVAALDRPIDADRLVLRKTAAGTTLDFVSRDGGFPFPPLASPDDPQSGTPGGMRVELFSAREGPAALAVPPGAGVPGWTTRSGPPARYRFRNPLAPGGPSPVRRVLLPTGRGVAIESRSAGLALAGPQGRVAIRITTGALRSCALFDAQTIVRDQPGRFSARHAVAASLPDCSDASMGLVPCALSNDPVEPTCGGDCSAGERCVGELDRQLAIRCACVPASVTACLDSGFPTCGGSCSGARQCQAFHLTFQEGNVDLASCACVDPAEPCDHPAGTCFALGVCPAGLVCGATGPPQALCGCAAP